jgi:hypothetical protein
MFDSVCGAGFDSCLLQGKAPPALPLYANTCYSFVTDEDVVHVASVHRYDAEKMLDRISHLAKHFFRWQDGGPLGWIGANEW